MEQKLLKGHCMGEQALVWFLGCKWLENRVPRQG